MKWDKFREEFRKLVVECEKEVLDEMVISKDERADIQRQRRRLERAKSAKYVWQILDVCQRGAWDVGQAVGTMLDAAGVQFPKSKPLTRKGRIPDSDDGYWSMSILMRGWDT